MRLNYSGDVAVYVKKQDDFALYFPTDAKEGTFSFMCPNARRVCQVRIHRDPPAHPIWGWDGDKVCPTITPSIGCDQSPRCGAHVNITNGVRTP